MNTGGFKMPAMPLTPWPGHFAPCTSVSSQRNEWKQPLPLRGCVRIKGVNSRSVFIPLLPGTGKGVRPGRHTGSWSDCLSKHDIRRCLLTLPKSRPVCGILEMFHKWLLLFRVVEKSGFSSIFTGRALESKGFESLV